MEDNIIDIISKVDSVEKCNQLCSENAMCKFYTFLGEGNHFRFVCTAREVVKNVVKIKNSLAVKRKLER